MKKKKKNDSVPLSRIHAESESVLFRQLWLMSTRKSYLSGLWLRDWINTPQFPSLFAHILPKRQNKFPHFRLYAKNIRLLTPDEHFLWDHSSEDQRISYSKEVKTADWSKIWALRDELEGEYRKYFPSTVKGIINYKYSPEEEFHILGNLNKEFWTKLERERKEG